MIGRCKRNIDTNLLLKAIINSLSSYYGGQIIIRDLHFSELTMINEALSDPEVIIAFVEILYSWFYNEL